MRGVFQRSHESKQCGCRFISGAADYFGEGFDLLFTESSSLNSDVSENSVVLLIFSSCKASLQSPKSFLDRVSTGSGSDLV